MPRAGLEMFEGLDVDGDADELLNDLANSNGGFPARGLSMLGDKIDVSHLAHVASREHLTQAYRRREAAAAQLKKVAIADWVPEYRPHSIVAPNESERDVLQKSIRVSSAMILEEVSLARKTKIVCTMGPACWSEEGIAALIDAGMNVARFNFSHGDHAAHQAVLDRVRKVAAEKNKQLACALDTKGPEIRTAMLKGGKDIQLVTGQDITIYAAGDSYTEWEGYKDEATGETKIGLSYDKLCQFVKPGHNILLADGTVTIQVVDILNDKELKGKVLNDKKLGQRKNCNIPGVVVDLPVLAQKDIIDVQDFACKNKMDYVFASFVQTADDVGMIRQVLKEGGGEHIQIIVKIESQAGLVHFDRILEETDGVMVARGDLAMEVPPEKVALAQKMMINKCMIAGKHIICATQMMESMIENPVPARAEMTDVANAVFDGTGSVMLSGESANGRHPSLVVSTMAKIVANAELGINYLAQFQYIRYQNASTAPVSPVEAILSGVARQAIAFCEDRDGDGVIDLSEGCMAVVLTESGLAAELVAKYRPPCPVIVVSPNETTLRKTSVIYGLQACHVPAFDDIGSAVKEGINFALQNGFAVDGIKCIVAHGGKVCSADESPYVTVENLGWKAMSFMSERIATEYRSPFMGNSIPCVHTIKIGTELICSTESFNHRSTKIVATIGPESWRPEQMRELLDSGIDMARFNVKYGSKKQNQNLLDTFRKVCAEKAADMVASKSEPPKSVPSGDHLMWGIVLGIKGPETRSSPLVNHKPVSVEAGQEVFVVGAGANYLSFEGGNINGQVVFGISIDLLGEEVTPGQNILLAEGTCSVEVDEIINPHKIRGTMVSAGKIGEHQLIFLPEAQVTTSLLSEKDIGDLKLAAENQVEYVSVPFVRSGEDVQEIRDVLDKAGGKGVQIIAQIDFRTAIVNFDSILLKADGIMVSRGNLGMTIPPEKVSLAQKWMLTKANLAGKLSFVAGNVMESMAANSRPSRPEITDVVNACFDGADAVVLMQETSVGSFAAACVKTVAGIIQRCEVGVDEYALYNFIRNYTPKPMTAVEAVCSSAVKAAIDMEAALIVLMTDTIEPVIFTAKYRPNAAIVVATSKRSIAQASCGTFGTVSLLLESDNFNIKQVAPKVEEYSKRFKLANFSSGVAKGDQLIFVVGPQDHRLATSADLGQLELLTLVLGDETKDLIKPTGYKGTDVIAYRSTKVDLDLIANPNTQPRKTKICCTLGPACWSEEGIEQLLLKGMDVARFNFSHGNHEGHKAVLDRVRKVAQENGKLTAYMLDTKGPEIRTAMLKDHKSIELTPGQMITVVSVGDNYTEWEGFKDENTGETRIGLSYPHLCQDVKPGGRILLADGQAIIEVQEIVSETEVLGKMLNHKVLGERKNCNLPGVKVKLPVLQAKDIDDVQNFACKYDMDLLSASFVQTADDVRFIRRVLREGGGEHIKIISKIESWFGVINFDEILAESDGIMVARGDLAMEIPSEKVALAQKMMTTKANIAGKFVITATQMLESMTESPLPTRAEMTDVANAVFDGTDAVMLSGESASGKFPFLAVETMASIVANAEVGTNYFQLWDFIRDFTEKPMGTLEAVVSNAARQVLDIDAGLIVLLAKTGVTARLVSKYRPKVPVLVVTDVERTARACAPTFALHAYLVPNLPTDVRSIEFDVVLEEAVIKAVQSGLCPKGKEIVVIHAVPTGIKGHSAVPMMRIKVAAGKAKEYKPSRPTDKTLSLRTTAIALDDILSFEKAQRKTKIVGTMGPASWSEEGLSKLLRAGLDVARFNFSHGDHKGHLEVLRRLRKVAKSEGKQTAYLLDTKGPEIRTAMLKDGKNIDLEAGQELTMVAVGRKYETFLGYKDNETGETVLGCSYDKLCQSVKQGSIIKIADGSVSLQVLEIVSDKKLKARVLNSKSIGQRKNMNLPGVKVDLPVLTDKDIDDLVNFGVRHKMDFVAASFVQAGEDVRYIRKILDSAGGNQIKIICKIENEEGLKNFNEILRYTDGIMVARGDLAMEVPSEKVALAQKMMITKANIAGKFVVTATQMLESMTSSPLPTRAEMTDVANAVFDGTDAVMLSGETANGSFPEVAVETMAAITANAENANSYYSTAAFIADHSPKPFVRLEAAASAAVGAVVDCGAALIVTFTVSGVAARVVSKYRPPVPQVVVTPQTAVANQANIGFGQYALKVEDDMEDLEALMEAAKDFAVANQLWDGVGTAIVLHGKFEPNADGQPVVSPMSFEGDEDFTEPCPVSRTFSRLA